MTRTYLVEPRTAGPLAAALALLCLLALAILWIIRALWRGAILLTARIRRSTIQP